MNDNRKYSVKIINLATYQLLRPVYKLQKSIYTFVGIPADWTCMHVLSVNVYDGGQIVWIMCFSLKKKEVVLRNVCKLQGCHWRMEMRGIMNHWGTCRPWWCCICPRGALWALYWREKEAEVRIFARQDEACWLLHTAAGRIHSSLSHWVWLAPRESCQSACRRGRCLLTTRHKKCQQRSQPHLRHCRSLEECKGCCHRLLERECPLFLSFQGQSVALMIPSCRLEQCYLVWCLCARCCCYAWTRLLCRFDRGTSLL